MAMTWARRGGRKRPSGHWKHLPPWQRQMKLAAVLWNWRIARVDAGPSFGATRSVRAATRACREMSLLGSRCLFRTIALSKAHAALNLRALRRFTSAGAALFLFIPHSASIRPKYV
jgi:hypothetical protein